jgi:hypothetical protein
MAPFRTEICGDFYIANLLIPKSYCLKLDGADAVYYSKVHYIIKYFYLTNLQMDFTKQNLIRVSLLHYTYKWMRADIHYRL